ncbi:MAG TPA: hypothetical protein DHV36_04235 [Desulfobacteraceae bacterium]|nr:hypothetical protein [Desulfobacteraceae bacterium]
MKISESNIQFMSNHSAEEADLVLQQETKETIQQQGVVSGRGRSGWVSEEGRPMMLVDRVSISLQQSREVQSEYSAALTSSSTVSGVQGDTVAAFEQKELVEKLAGAVMDRAVVARSIREGVDIGGEQATGPVTAVRTNTTESLVTLSHTSIHFEQEQMGFSSQGQVVTQDGRTIDFNLDMALDRAYMSRTQEQAVIHTWQQEINLTDPLVINLEGGIPQLGDTRFEFDLDNDGTTEEISFAAKGSGFLSFDRNADGVINNGSELFGPGTGNGFEELAAYDDDGNGWIDESDAVFSNLSVWTRDGQGNDQLISLKDAGVGAIYLDNAQTEFSATTMDNELQGQVRRSGVFLFEDGNVGAMQQIDLAAREPGADASAAGAFQESTQLGDFTVVNLASMNMGGNTGGITGPSPIEAEDVENPLSALMEQIEALKEELQQILGTRSSRGRRAGRLRSMANTFSDHQLYRLTHPNPAGLKAQSWQA